MMAYIIVGVVAFVIAQVIAGLGVMAIMLGVCMNRRFVKWYYRKFIKAYMELIEEINEEEM